VVPLFNIFRDLIIKPFDILLYFIIYKNIFKYKKMMQLTEKTRVLARS
jgi:hypothetical protein